MGGWSWLGPELRRAGDLGSFSRTGQVRRSGACSNLNGSENHSDSTREPQRVFSEGQIHSGMVLCDIRRDRRRPGYRDWIEWPGEESGYKGKLADSR